MKIGFIGLGNVGGKLAGSLLRNEFDLTLRDLDDALVQPFARKGAASAISPKEMAEKVDLVVKDVGFFDKLAIANNVPVEISPLVLNIFKDGQESYGSREFSPNIIKRLEEACGCKILGAGFPAEMTDDEPEEKGYEVKSH